MSSIFKNITTSDIRASSNNISDIGSSVSKFKDLHIGGIINPGGSLPLPNLTTVQRDALTPASGDIIYNTTTNAQEYYNGTSWGSPMLIGGSFIDVTNNDINALGGTLNLSKTRAEGQISTNDNLGNIVFRGQTEIGQQIAGDIRMAAIEPFTNTSRGTSLILSTTTIGGTANTPRVIIRSDDVSITTPLTLSNTLTQLQRTTPTAPSGGTDRLYFKSDDQLYRQSSAGTESKVGDNFDTLNIVNNVSDFSESTLNISKTRAGGQLLSNDVLGRVQFKGQTDTTLVNGGSISTSANQTFTSGSHGTSMAISTVTNNTGTEAVRMFINNSAVIVNPPLELSSEIVQTQQTKPTAPLSTTNKLYFASDDNLYTQDSTGQELKATNELPFLFDTQLTGEQVDTTSITFAGGGGLFFGGVLAPNRKIYMIPNNATFVGILNTDTNTVDTTSITGLTGSAKYRGGCLAPNGRDIYCCPQNAQDILVINTHTDTTSFIAGVNGAAGGWYGCCLSPETGLIYCCPYNETRVLIINPSNNTFDLTSLTGLSAFTNKYTGCCLAPNGLIYCSPDTEQNVLIIDPVNLTLDTTTIAGLSPASLKWEGIVTANNGFLYCIPRNITSILVINPATNTSSFITGVTAGTGSRRGGVLAPNGKIYCSPTTFTTVLVIDPSDDSFTESSITGLSADSGKYIGVNIGIDGNLYFIPANASNVMKVIPSGLKTVSLERCTSAYYNKF